MCCGADPESEAHLRPRLFVLEAAPGTGHQRRHPKTARPAASEQACQERLRPRIRAVATASADVGIEPARASLRLRFAGPPDNPGQPVFPGPVRNFGISSLGLPSL